MANLLKPGTTKSFTLYVSGKNLYTWTRWEGWDPEATDWDDDNVLLNGLNNSGRPVLRGVTVGFNITY